MQNLIRKFIDALRPLPIRSHAVAVVALWAVVALIPRSVDACDLCAIYTATTLQDTRPGLSLTIAEQFTSFNTLQVGGDDAPNPDGERIESSITQLLVGYRLHPRLQLQASVPFISRAFRRVGEDGAENGTEEGVGDVSLLARFGVLRAASSDGVANLDVIVGLKLPTGDTDRLGEEGAEHHDEAGDEHEEGEVESGVHGHDLTLGTGSVDVFVGINGFVNRGRAFAAAAAQYTGRGSGDFGYEYANDVQWDAGAGAFLLLDHRHSLALSANVHGESKGKDVQNGARLADTQAEGVYLGPKVVYTYKNRANADIGFELPVHQETTAVQLVPDYRVRGAITWRF